MITIEQVEAVIFDLDDTLLDNGPKDKPEEWLHSRSRLAAVHAVADKYGMTALRGLTLAENGQAFRTAKTHSLQGAIWNGMFMRGVVDSAELDTTSPLYERVLEIAALKNELHGPVLREFGREVAGSTEFIRDLANHGLRDRIAMATMAVRRDIDIYLEMTGTGPYFPPERVVSNEMISQPKPDPESFDRAFRTLGLPDSSRRNVPAFEDDPRGLRSAKAAGLYTIALTQRYDRDDPLLLAAEPDIIADSYDEVRLLLGMRPATAAPI